MVALCSVSMVTTKLYFPLFVYLSAAYSNIDFSLAAVDACVKTHTSTSKKSYAVFAFAQTWTQTSTTALNVFYNVHGLI